MQPLVVVWIMIVFSFEVAVKVLWLCCAVKQQTISGRRCEVSLTPAVALHASHQQTTLVSFNYGHNLCVTKKFKWPENQTSARSEKCTHDYYYVIVQLSQCVTV